jgi:hypothetical protein
MPRALRVRIAVSDREFARHPYQSIQFRRTARHRQAVGTTLALLSPASSAVFPDFHRLRRCAEAQNMLLQKLV